MKITCAREKLTEAVLNVQRAVSAKSAIPALEGILLKAKEGSVFLCGYDLELGMTTEIPASVTETGSVVLSAKLFGEIVRRLPDDGVHITTDDKNLCTIESGQSSFSIAGIPAAEYPELPAVQNATQVEVPCDILKSMIHQTIFAVAETDAKPIHTGTLFELSDGKLRLVSVDGYRLALREEQVGYTGEELSFVVPGKTLQEVGKLLAEDDSPCSLQVGARHILFTIDRYTVISRLLEGEFLDYRAAIPQSSSTEVVLKTRDLMDSVERVSLLIADRLKSPVRCVFEEEGIRLSCFTSMGRASDHCPARLQGEELEMGFNNRYLLDALRNTEGDEVKLQISGALSPMRVVPMEGDSFLFLVLPVRLKSDN